MGFSGASDTLKIVFVRQISDESGGSFRLGQKLVLFKIQARSRKVRPRESYTHVALHLYMCSIVEEARVHVAACTAGQERLTG